MSKTYVLAIHLYGYVLVFFQAFGMSLMLMWVLQTLALSSGETYDWAAVLWHLFLLFSFVAFFPGQTFWTLRLTDSRERVQTIVGRTEQDSGTTG